MDNQYAKTFNHYFDVFYPRITSQTLQISILSQDYLGISSVIFENLLGSKKISTLGPRFLAGFIHFESSYFVALFACLPSFNYIKVEREKVGT